MNQKHHYPDRGRAGRRVWITFFLFCLLATGFMQAANKAFAQTTVTASFKNATLSEILWEIQRQTDFTFVYSTSDVKQVQVRSLNVNNEKIADVLEKCLKDSGLTYSEHEGVITIRKAEERAAAAPQRKFTFKGNIVDESGEPVIGANIVVKGTTTGTTSDIEGNFSLDTDKQQVVLVISFVGYTRQEVKASAGKVIRVT